MLALGGRGRGLLLHAGQHTQVHWGESCEKSVSDHDDDNYHDNGDDNDYDDEDGDHNGDDHLPGIFWDASSLLFWVRPTSTIGPQEGRRLESSGLHSLTFIVFEYQHLNTKMTRSNLFRHGGLIPWDDDLDICVKEQVSWMMMA